MPDKIEVEDKWDFYPCRVDNHPASMSVNMAYIDHAPISGADTVYRLTFEQPDPGEHGMGTQQSFDVMCDVEDAFFTHLSDSELYFVGRLRNMGKWELYFFGCGGQDRRIEDAAAKAIQQTTNLPYDFGSKPDPEWSGYTNYIYPSPERHRWMADRSVVDVLAEHNDLHNKPRRIDHWIYFAAKDDREAMAKAVAMIGFAREDDPEDGDGDLPFGLQLYRDDPSELNHINSVTSRLCEIADENGGSYDGWETFIVNDD
ncbi:DUF695 domain-containing protein [Phycisphaeraceae bacterium D3-23]